MSNKVFKGNFVDGVCKEGVLTTYNSDKVEEKTEKGQLNLSSANAFDEIEIKYYSAQNIKNSCLRYVLLYYPDADHVDTPEVFKVFGSAKAARDAYDNMKQFEAKMLCNNLELVKDRQIDTQGVVTFK